MSTFRAEWAKGDQTFLVTPVGLTPPSTLRGPLRVLYDVVTLAKEASVNSPHASADWPENRKVAPTASSLMVSLPPQVLLPSIFAPSHPTPTSPSPCTYQPRKELSAEPGPGPGARGSPGLSVAASAEHGSSCYRLYRSTRMNASERLRWGRGLEVATAGAEKAASGPLPAWYAFPSPETPVPTPRPRVTPPPNRLAGRRDGGSCFSASRTSGVCFPGLRLNDN